MMNMGVCVRGCVQVRLRQRVRKWVREREREKAAVLFGTRKLCGHHFPLRLKSVHELWKLKKIQVGVVPIGPLRGKFM